MKHKSPPSSKTISFREFSSKQQVGREIRIAGAFYYQALSDLCKLLAEQRKGICKVGDCGSGPPVRNNLSFFIIHIK